MRFSRIIGPAAVVVASLAFAAPAHADENRYLSDMHNAGIFGNGDDTALLSGGWAVCHQLSAGSSRDEVAGEVVDGYHYVLGYSYGYYYYPYAGLSNLNPADAGQAVAFANDDLCPNP